MIETQMGLLNETISNMAKKFEEEKRELEGACAAKESEIGNLRRELDDKSGQLQNANENIGRLEGEVQLLHGRIEELIRAQKEELEGRERARQEELEKEKELVEATIRSMDQIMMDERNRWREVLRSN